MKGGEINLEYVLYIFIIQEKFLLYLCKAATVSFIS